MPSSNHTPGPWAVKSTYNENELAIYCGYGADRNDWGGRPDGIYPPAVGGPREIARVTKDSHTGAFEANALLIASAPDLLAALELCLPDLEHYVSTHGPGPDKRLLAAKAAIAKAKGE